MAYFKGIYLGGIEKLYTETFHANSGIDEINGYGEGYGQHYGGFPFFAFHPIGLTFPRIQNPTISGYGQNYGNHYGGWRLFQFPRRYTIGYGRYYGKWYGYGPDSALLADTQPLINYIPLYISVITTHVPIRDVYHWGITQAYRDSGVKGVGHFPVALFTRNNSMYTTWLGFGVKPEE